MRTRNWAAGSNLSAPDYDTSVAIAQIAAINPTPIMTRLRPTAGRSSSPSRFRLRVGGRSNASPFPTTSAPPKARTNNCNKSAPPRRSLTPEPPERPAASGHGTDVTIVTVVLRLDSRPLPNLRPVPDADPHLRSSPARFRLRRRLHLGLPSAMWAVVTEIPKRRGQHRRVPGNQGCPHGSPASEPAHRNTGRFPWRCGFPRAPEAITTTERAETSGTPALPGQAPLRPLSFP